MAIDEIPETKNGSYGPERNSIDSSSDEQNSNSPLTKDFIGTKVSYVESGSSLESEEFLKNPF